jgi:cytochrome c
MDAFEFNKMAGALLGALVLSMAVGIVGESVFAPRIPVKLGDDLPIPKPAAGGGAAPAPVQPLPVLLAKASVQKGESDTRACQACHNFEKGAAVKIGPPLYGVVGRPIASSPGFDYSSALKGKGGAWTYDNLFAWIAAPSEWAPGTKMAFAGESDPQKRADILDYLHSLSDNPVPLPTAAAAPTPAPGGPAAKSPATPTAPNASASPADSAK